MTINEMPEIKPSETKEGWLARAAVVALDGNSTQEEVVAAEDKLGIRTAGGRVKVANMPATTSVENDLKNEWVDRCLAAGVDSSSTQDQVLVAEANIATKNESEKQVASERVLRARAVGLPDNASQAQIELEEKDQHKPFNEPTALARRARATGLQDTATLDEVVAAEKGNVLTQPSLANRASAVGLPVNSTEAQIVAEENRRK